MIVEVTGTNFQNKGAELMLRAISGFLYQKIQDVKVVVQPWNGNFYMRSVLGLFQKLSYQRYKVQWSGLLGLLPAPFLAQYGIIKEKEINVILDASGFLYSDQWDASLINKVARYYISQRKKGCKIILMPQAFGPFEKRDTRDAFIKIFELCDLIYARDLKSYEYLIDTFGKNQKIRLSPDFTILLSNQSCKTSRMKTQRILGIMPNYRMIDKLIPEHSEAYITIFRELISHFREQGYEIHYLIHETTTDHKVLELIGGIDDCDKIINEQNAFKLKELIGQCDLVIGSRFHGIVNALTQNIPAIVMGWSHKYEMLLKDYECEELMIRTDENLNHISDLVKKLSTKSAYSHLVDRIRLKNEFLRGKVNQMWAEIIEECNQ